MTDALQQFHRQSQAWAQEAQQAGWLTATDVSALENIDLRRPTTLFDDTQQRPLVVAFFGGTGVGKSSLLNRLAGEAVARTGVERPTSREVTLYVHRSVPIKNLPEVFPLEQVKIALHQAQSHQSILWIDMPDVDSVETKNKALVLEWLPHIDVLVYMVSPERYRDDRGWQLLLEHGHSHAWLFVMGQWDSGHATQKDAFSQQLNQAGFKQPLIFCTNNGTADKSIKAETHTASPDDFNALAETVQSLANAHTISQLEIRGLTLRRQAMRQDLLQALETMGKDESFKALEKYWPSLWKPMSTALSEGLAWKITALASGFATQENSLLTSFKKATPPPEKTTASLTHQTSEGIEALWDDWANTRLNDALDGLLGEADVQALPMALLRTRLSELRENAPAQIQNHLQTALRTALFKPGNALQRLAYRSTGFLAAVLPLSALIWVGYRVVTGYYQSALTSEQYLGIDFTTHSALLVIIAWSLPWMLQQKLKPSQQKAALRGLQTGLTNGLFDLEQRIKTMLKTWHKEQQGLKEKAEAILQQHNDVDAPALLDNDTLARMLVTRIPPN